MTHTEKIFAAGHALLIGVGGADIPKTVDDAKALADILKDQERCAYPPEQVKLLTGQDADRNRILDALDKVAQSSDINSTIIIYFSGHGSQITSSIGEAYFLIPHGYDINRLNKTAISGAEFAAKLRALKAKKILLLLDCCHAGGIGEAKGLEIAKAPLPPEALEVLGCGSGRVIIASSQADESSFAGEPYSAFTLALIESLCGIGVARKDGFVRVADLAMHAREAVPGRTKNKQHPILSFEQADNFVVAYYSGGDSSTKALPFQELPEIEPEPGAWQNEFNQKQNAGTQTNIVGDVNGPILSGIFRGPVNILEGRRRRKT
ncbi:MAG: caspase family protein [Methanothrix sp.]|nr:caspase family protein [Methanothrix sp.]MDD4446412.1 caspase family protein [Methanothrix sp.]